MLQVWIRFMAETEPVFKRLPYRGLKPGGLELQPVYKII
jgi:hypothetical protein